MTYFFSFSLLLGLLSACSLTPPGPKQPDESNRLPINKTFPEELKVKGS